MYTALDVAQLPGSGLTVEFEASIEAVHKGRGADGVVEVLGCGQLGVVAEPVRASVGGEELRDGFGPRVPPLNDWGEGGEVFAYGLEGSSVAGNDDLKFKFRTEGCQRFCL